MPTLRAVRATVLVFVLVPGLAPSAQAQGAVAERRATEESDGGAKFEAAGPPLSDRFRRP